MLPVRTSSAPLAGAIDFLVLLENETAICDK
jgi:hypothetical protein